MDGNKEMELMAQDISSTISFDNLDFPAGSSAILPEMENNLHLVVDFLVKHPSYNLKIIGHTSSEGDPAKNLELSTQRATTIKEYIISYADIPSKRVVAVGVGSQEPIISPELSEHDRKINRRVDFDFRLNTF